ncbi:MAG: prepilin-type N-terminal cleavage/methylation domain-containing protein, partial [Verrucomicrobia bacterium]|nr:prepilin-type N-terminal cleavage/methylation domain-containing protein [Verrucomicrobiota bacterium]
MMTRESILVNFPVQAGLDDGSQAPGAWKWETGGPSRLDSPKSGRRRASCSSAFSLIEVLVGLFVLSIAAIAITSAWRLADYQELLARVDRRAERILRQYYELQTFAPASYKPFYVTSDSNQQFVQNSITGYLYHPRLINNQSGPSQFGNLIPFTISMKNGSGTGNNQLVMIYTVPGYGA